MESIDRLREYLDKNVRKLPHTEWIANEPMELRPSRIYDYIDAIEREVDDNARFRAEAEPFHDRLCKAAEAREDVTLWGVDYMPLPLDADGEPIRVGDVMETDNGIREVDALQRSSRKWSVGLVPVGGGAFSWHDAEAVRHHRTPTVEDVLREFADEVWNRYCNGTTASDSGIRELEAEYAARLTLRGEE